MLVTRAGDLLGLLQLKLTSVTLFATNSLRGLLNSDKTAARKIYTRLLQLVLFLSRSTKKTDSGFSEAAIIYFFIQYLSSEAYQDILACAGKAVRAPSLGSGHEKLS